MARTASIAIGGYYPTPEHLVARIANLFAIAPHVDEDDEPWRGKPTASFLDPCAGDGAAVSAFATAVAGNNRAIYVCEMEASRAEALGRLSWGHGGVRVARGDAFRVEMEKGSGISCLYLNPPYDLDRVHGRLEQRFLCRFAPMLAMGGYLVFVVPHYALAASAEYLAREFDKVSCFRFPPGDFDVFKQVVLVARKAETFATSRADVERSVRGWSADVSSCEDLPEANAPVERALVLPTSRQQAIDTWNMRPVDVAHALTMAKPWSQTTRRGAVATIPGLLPDGPVQDLLLRRYPVATPPRPAHIASGIASGIFNGSRIDATPEGMPPLLVKGVFTREFRTIEEKTNKDGDVTAEVQVQQPKLVTTVLDLSTYTYHTLSHGKSGSTEVAQMGIMDLLENYGSGLMTVMESQCPILYDPRRDAAEVSLPASPRKLFTAQQHACRAIVKLLGGPHATRKERRGKAAFLLGEIGSGKSTVALVSAKAIGLRRPLVLCPPHLLTSWTNEVRAVFPDAEVRVLTNVSEVDALASDTSDRMIVAVMSREAAKLGHGWEPVGMVCPTCGTTPSTTGMDQVKKRARCSFRPITPRDVPEARDTDGAAEEEARTSALLARSAIKLAHLLANYAPNDDTVRACMHGRFDEVRRERHKERPWAGLPRGYLKDVIPALVARLQKAGDHDETQAAGRALVFALLADFNIATVSSVVTQLLPKNTYDYANNAFHVAQLLPRASKEWSEAAEAAIGVNGSRHWSSPWETAKNETRSEENVFGFTLYRAYAGLEYNHVRENSLNASIAVLRALGRAGAFVRGKECGEFLYQAVPEPRRVALAKYITRRHPGMFDALVLDEGHEYGNDTSAQGMSAHRLSGLGLPTILMTGSVMNGYAESLFANMWALSPSFREEFSREDKQRFIDRYGYRKRIVETKEEGKVVAFGKVSDRVERVERPAGNAPGILPVFILRHLLPMSVTLHKADLAIDLPPCTIERHVVNAEKDILDGYTSLRDKLVRQIREDAFDPERAGKLFGQLAEMPSYLDRATADVGNDDFGDFSICYPESVGGGVVASVEGKPAARILAKEEWMLRQVEQELAEGRAVMVFSWHLGLLPRLARLIAERTGGLVPVLNADRVPASKRQAWIDREVIKKGARVLVTNPVCIQTGLNNLIHFATEIWMENPACNPITFRQAIGRIDRIGQKLPSRIHFPVYGGTLQEKLYDLLMHKVAVSVATDGLDPESALQAAGVGDDEYMTGLSIGKQIYAMLTSLRSDRLASQHDRWYAFGMDHSVKVALLVYAACGFVWMLRGAWKLYEAIGDEEKRAWMDSQLPPGFSLDDRHVAFGAAIGMAISVAIHGVLWPYMVASYVWTRITYRPCACLMCERARRDDDVPPASADVSDDDAKK